MAEKLKTDMFISYLLINSTDTLTLSPGMILMEELISGPSDVFSIILSNIDHQLL